MNRMISTGALALAIVGMALPVAPADARRVHGVTGGNGDFSVSPECPAGEYLVGFSGRVGLWIDQIQILCARRNGNAMGGAVARSDQLGGWGGGPTRAVCPGNTRLHSVSISYTRDYKQVARIGMVCASLTDNSGSHLSFGGSYSGVAKKCGVFTGCSPEEVAAQNVYQNCPQEQFVGATIRAGKHVNAIGFICDRR